MSKSKFSVGVDEILASLKAGAPQPGATATAEGAPLPAHEPVTKTGADELVERLTPRLDEMPPEPGPLSEAEIADVEDTLGGITDVTAGRQQFLLIGIDKETGLIDVKSFAHCSECARQMLLAALSMVESDPGDENSAITRH